MSEALHERVRRMRERLLIRTWEYRQRNLAKGVWFRLRRVLVDAAEAWIIDERDADRLETDGHLPLPVGRALAPPKRMFFLTEAEVAAISDRRRVPVRLGGELLQASAIALVAHAEIGNST